MNARQSELVRRIYQVPTRPDIIWSDVEKLIEALGGTVKTRSGSHVTLELHGRKGFFSRPHPGRQSSKGAIEGVRDFLRDVGVEP